MNSPLLTSERPLWTPTAIAVLACFALSGATGLVYEVVWVRMLGLVFGHTVPAVTTVLVAFMAGLGGGALLAGRVADRIARPFRVYALLELAIGATAVVVTLLTPVAEAAYVRVFPSLAAWPLAYSAGRFALVFVLLLVPTTLMGATLPVLTRAFAGDARHAGFRVGALYALNTAGAVAGTALAGYGLLPWLGMRATVIVTAVANVLIGLLVVRLDRRADGAAADATDAFVPLDLPLAPTAADTRTRTLALAGLAVSGAAAMAYEIAWTRGLALVIGSSTYAFTAMLVSFLTGIALGSAVAARLTRDRRVDPATFGLVQVGAGAAALAILPAFDRLPDVLARTFSVSMAPGFVLAVQLLLGIAAMIVPAGLLGAAFPCAVALLAATRDRIGRDVGTLYAANTAGAIAGTAAAGFLLIPMIGAHATVKTAVVANLVVGAAALTAGLRAGTRRGVVGATLAVVTLACVFVVPAWNPAVMASGVAVYGHVYRGLAGRLDVAETQGDSAVVFYEDGVSATVTVHQRGVERFMRINGKTDASSGRDMRTQLMLGHLPLLVHPDARSALVIGLGSGVTASAVARHPVTRVEVVEIEPAVVRASRFFERENRGVLGDPRVRLTIGDARNVLLAGGHRYDVIVSEPSNPWIGGIATLYSAEFYALARSRLAPGGVMVQWVQGYGIAPEDLRMIVRTFRSAFPATTIWYPNVRGDYLLVGRDAPRPLDLARLRVTWDTTAGVRAEVGGASPYAVLAHFVLSEADAARYAGDGPLNTDDRLPLEFSAPRSMHLDTEATNLRVIASFRQAPWPLLSEGAAAELDRADVRYALGLVHLEKDAFARAAPEFEQALARDPTHVPAMVDLGVTLARLGLGVRAVETLQAAVAREPGNARAHAELARAYRVQQLVDRAIDHARKAVALAPADGATRGQLAALLADGGRADEAIEQYLGARAAAPGDATIADGLATLYLARGRLPEAIAVLEDALRADARSTRLLQRAGRAYLAAARHDDAIAVLRRAVGTAPTVGALHADLGAAYLGRGQLVPAIAALERGLAFDPAQPAALALLAQAYRARGD